MRVIAGQYRSRKLQTLSGSALRPTSDRLRETLFNILAPTIENAVFVDLFAGSGAVGIEALSRGARQAIFVENHPSGIALLRRNLQQLGITPGAALTVPAKTFPGTAELLPLDAEAALERLAARHIHPDIVFADPPYADSKAYDAVLEFVGDSGLLAKDGRVIFEHASKRELPPVAGALERTRVVEQGDSTLSFYNFVLAA
jgi:16S rRNA (guanine(966)-N(2))-methyltransferase RsmD